MTRAATIAIATALVLALAACAPPPALPGGVPDPDFGADGRVVLDVRVGSDDRLSAVVEDGDGLLVGGTSEAPGEDDFMVARFLSDGTLDTAFGTNGYVFVDGGASLEFATAMIRTASERLILGGLSFQASTDIVLMAFTSDGALDPTFGGGGIATLDLGGSDALFALLEDAQGRLLLAGRTGTVGSDLMVARLTSDGALDPTFGAAGAVGLDLGGTDGATDLGIDAAGRLVAVGFGGGDVVLVRLLDDGSPDPTFGSGGTVLSDINGSSDSEGASSLAIDGQGRLLLAGWSESGDETDYLLLRYLDDGTLDPAFGMGGVTLLDLEAGPDEEYLETVVLDAQGRATAVGGSESASDGISDAVALRFTADGTLDTTFGQDGLLVIDEGEDDDSYANFVILDGEGRLVVAGYSDGDGDTDLLLARILP